MNLQPTSTERLLIRKLEYADHEAWQEFMKSEEATRFFPDSIKNDSAVQAISWIERQLQRYAENRYGLQALICRKTGELIGQCGLLSQEVDGKQELEIGYHVFPKFWGKGYASEAAQAFRNHAFQNDLSDSLISIIHIENIASQKVALKNGMQRGKRTDFAGLDVFIYRISKEEWIKLTGKA